MFRDGLTWCMLISLPYRRNHEGNYILERIQVQPRLLEVLRDLPTCTGVEVRREVIGIEDFYTMLSEETVELNSFVDLSSMYSNIRLNWVSTVDFVPQLNTVDFVNSDKDL